MAVSFSNLHSETGLEKLDGYLLSRSYITGYQASKDDLCVYAALSGAPSSKFVNVCRWYDHISALLRLSGVSEEGEGVKVETSASYTEEASASPPISDAKIKVDEEDDDDVDLFGEETEEEKKAAEERAAAIKVSGKKKESGKSSVLLDIKPWDDETDMKKLEETVRSVQMEGLLWGASKLVPVGYGIKKLQIMMTIVDDLVSVDNLIEDYLTVEPANEYIQSCDIVAFNKIYPFQPNRTCLSWSKLTINRQSRPVPEPRDKNGVPRLRKVLYIVKKRRPDFPLPLPFSQSLSKTLVCHSLPQFFVVGFLSLFKFEMAYLRSIGGFIKLSASRSGLTSQLNPMMSMLNAVRYASSKLFVGGLSYGTDDQSLKDAFSGYGNVTEARVITDRDTGRSRGFGFVNFESDDSASSALSSMDGQELDGRNIRVSYANDRPSGGYRAGGGGGGSFGGGYRGGAGNDDFGEDSGKRF